MGFNNKYNDIKKIVQDELDIIEEKMVNEIDIREPLYTSVVKFLKSPSKRIRSVLTLLYLKAIGKKIVENQLEILSVIELIHNASLIHDDIIDDCDLRRGEKTISANFGNKLGVICGDYLLAISMKKLSKIGNSSVIEILSKTISAMCIGEINQNFDRYKVGDLENYLEKTKNKTAYLFEAAMISCAEILEIKDLKKISDFSLNVGIAFQIRDDLLNFTHNDLSKPINNDLSSGIYNAPVILGSDVDNYAQGIEKTKDLLNNYVESARNLLSDIPENECKNALENFLELLNNV